MRSQHRLAFSLRTLFIVLTIGCVGCVFVATWLQRARSQQRAVLDLREANADVYYDYQERALGQYGPAPSPDGWLVRVAGIDCVHSVVAVELMSRNTTDASLATLRRLPHLRSLEVVDTKITADGLAHLAKCQSIQSLAWVYNPSIDGDKAAQAISQMKSLEELNIRCTSISDNGLCHLEHLSRLRNLTLSGPPGETPRFTKKGMKRLEEALPDCSIEIDVPWWLKPFELEE